MIDVETRARAVGLTLAAVCRRTGLSYWRLTKGAKLTPAEIGKLEEALAAAADQLEEKRTAQGLPARAAQEVNRNAAGALQATE